MSFSNPIPSSTIGAMPLSKDNSTFAILVPKKRTHKNKHPGSPVVAVLSSRPTENIDRLTNSKTLYKDSWFDQIAINHLSQSVQAATGLRNKKSGYNGLVEVAIAASKAFSTAQQQDLVVKALEKAFPRAILSLIRTLLPESQFAREYFAVVTTIFFGWLIGPCEVRKSDINGRIEKNVVHIKKCRFLEETNCAGMCTNLCKMPSQMFIKDSLGMPVNMVPNFDDMSCEMIFGQEAPPRRDDPAFKQPCYKLCKASQKHSRKCTS